MQIWKSKDSDPFNDSALESSAPFSGKNRISDLLDVEVISAQKGLQVLRIGNKSPFCRLKPLGCFTMQGLVEQGDQIVAVDGILLKNPGDLIQLVKQSLCEVTIFDHRTRLTVSWQIHVREMLESA